MVDNSKNVCSVCHCTQPYLDCHKDKNQVWWSAKIEGSHNDVAYICVYMLTTDGRNGWPNHLKCHKVNFFERLSNAQYTLTFLSIILE